MTIRSKLDFDLSEHNLDETVAEAFAKSLKYHIDCVTEAGRKIGVEERQLEIHDESKWSEAEFPGYARHFHGGGAPDEFARAWLHHIHYNPHHWQHWIFADGYIPKGSECVEDGVLEMPLSFAFEMVADWMGAGRTYTGSWDMTDWLQKNMHKIIVHSNTAKLLRHILNEQGYASVIGGKRFCQSV